MVKKVQRRSPEGVCRKDVLRNFAKFTGNSCARVIFNKKKRGAGTDVFL